MTEREIRRSLAATLTPLPAETREWYRAAGDCLCETCGHPYRLHPGDPASIFDWQNIPALHVLCNGDRVKL